MIPNADPSTAVPVGLEFLIGEPNWVGFSFDGTFYALSDLFF